MNCPACQSQIAPGTTFCPECGARVPQSPQPLRVLQGRYELTRKLGEGGMGAVYLASDRRLSTARWAIKELSEAQITSPLERQQAAESFRQEAEMLAALDHPHLPRVTDSFTEDERSYLVMELVPGETLLSYARRVGLPRPLPEVLEWARQLCEVLDYLHSRQPPVIFRDLKPANVMRTPEGSLKLIDFGIARHFKAGQTKDTQAFGTPGYSAPEQYGRGQTDARSDLYSLSVLLHQLLTGYDPANTPFQIPPAGQLSPDVPPAISEVLARGMHNDPVQRFPSVAEFHQALLRSGNLVQRASVEAVAGRVSAPPATGTGQPQWGAQTGTGQPQWGAQTGGTAAPPAQGTSTGVAVTAMWLGLGSAALMAIAAAAVAAGAASGDPESPLVGLGAVMALPTLLLGPAATILGFVALFHRATQATARGRRDAIIGIAAGLLTLLLCCGLIAIFPSSSSTSSEGRLPGGLDRAHPVGAIAGRPCGACIVTEALDG